MADIYAYADASMDLGDGVTAIAGFVGQARHFEELEERWTGLLAINGLTHFRMSEIRQRFHDPWKVVEPFYNLLQGSSLRHVGSTLLNEDWAQLADDAKYRAVFPQKQLACLDMFFSIIREEIDLSWPGASVALILDQDYGNNSLPSRVYAGWRERTGKAGFNSVTFTCGEASKGSLPMQFADCAAGILRMNWFNRSRLYGENQHARWGKSYMFSGRTSMWSFSLAAEVEEALRQRESRP